MRLKRPVQAMLNTLLSVGLLASSTLACAEIKLSAEELANQLGWVASNGNRCNGYYLEPPIIYSSDLTRDDLLQVTSDQYFFSPSGTSRGEGTVTLTRFGQQVTANKAFFYRDILTNKLSAIELVDHVSLREPNTLVIAKRGRFDLMTQSKSLHDILYRTAIYSDRNFQPSSTDIEDTRHERKVMQLSAWGEAKQFHQEQANVYQYEQVSYTTCPPLTHIWKMQASRLVLNKETGRGTARHARLLFKGVPVFYAPYFNFPIDKRRQTGFLSPIIGTSSKSGSSLALPFYWNLAPNYDSTITPAFYTRRGFQLTDLTRYLTPKSSGAVQFSVLPNDLEFQDFRLAAIEKFQPSLISTTQGNLHRLENASDTRGAFSWQDKTIFNPHWSTNIDVNYASDDYYLKDMSNNLNAITQNQLLQQAEANYKGQNWNFIGRIQGYQTLHPVDEPVVFNNQYMRFPQLILSGNYPNMPAGLDYTIYNDLSHFDIRHDPGMALQQPIGNRLHVQPVVSRPWLLPYLTVTPRVQLAATQYGLANVAQDNLQRQSRVLPIFDINSKLFFTRQVKWFDQLAEQTLEPQLYYVYIPYRKQDNIPLFDTTQNTLTYDQLFNYNRFSGIDRIGDTHQVSMGLASRWIDSQSGLEKVRLGIGQIFYFKNRQVTLCNPNDALCLQNNLATTQGNHYNRSPIAGVLDYHFNSDWAATANTIWNTQMRQLDNQSFTLHYQPIGTQKIFNIGYDFVRNGDAITRNNNTSASTPDLQLTNLSQTNISFGWPVARDWSAVGRWSQNWSHNKHFQNLLYGLQYDSCCWAVRFVTGRVFTGLSQNNTFQYDTKFFLQFALKGLDNIGNADPSGLINSSISGYQSNFGRDF